MFGCFYVKRFDIFNKRAFIFVSQFFKPFKSQRQAFAFEPFNHFVISRIGIRREMTDVGNIDRLFNLISKIFKGSAKNVCRNISAQITNVSIVVNCRSAIIHSHFVGFNWFKIFKFARESVVNL